VGLIFYCHYASAHPAVERRSAKSERCLLIGILGAYFFHRSDAECLEKLPACNLTSETALTIFCSCLTSFLMLGWKLGQAFKIHTKINEVAKYRALYQQVAGSYGEDEAERMKKLADGEAAAAAPAPGGGHLAAASAIVPSVVGVQAAPPHPAAHAHPPHLGAGAGPAAPHFVAQQVVPGIAAPHLGNIAHAQEPVPAPVEVRGVCDGCGQNVLSNDDGRKREGAKYYHSHCVKGMCGGCAKVVHAEAARVVLGGVYWHMDCAQGH
jgi:hypothetical protein